MKHYSNYSYTAKVEGIRNYIEGYIQARNKMTGKLLIMRKIMMEFGVRQRDITILEFDNKLNNANDDYEIPAISVDSFNEDHEEGFNLKYLTIESED